MNLVIVDDDVLVTTALKTGKPREKGKFRSPVLDITEMKQFLFTAA